MRLALLCLVVLTGSMGRGDTTVHMSPDLTKQTAYVANGLLKLRGQKSDFITLFLMDYATALSASSTEGGPHSLSRDLQWMETTLRNNQRLSDGSLGLEEYSHFRRTAVNFLLELGKPALPIPIALIQSSVNLIDASVDYIQEPGMRGEARKRLAGMDSYYRYNASWVLGRYHAQAAKDSRLEMVDALYFAPFLGASVQDQAYTILKDNPDFKQDQILEQIFKYTGPGGALEQQFSNLENLSKLQGERIFALLTENRAALRHLVQFVDNEEALKREALGKRLALEQARAKLAHADASIFVLGSLLGLTDARAGRVLSATWQAAMRVNQAFQGFQRVAATQGSFGASALLTGNIIGAFTSLVGIFGKDPSLVLLHEILSQLEQLREQVLEFQQEMRLHFDHVDGRLNGIYDSLRRATGVLTHRLEANQERIVALDRDLRVLALRVGTLDLNLRSYLNQAKDEELRQLEMLCLRSSVRGSNVDYEAYTQCLNHLEVCAVQSSTGPTRAGIAGDFFVEGELQLSRVGERLSALLNGRTAIGNANWLDAFIIPTHEALTRLGVGSASKGLPNAAAWGSCTTTYRDVVLENPEYFQYGSENKGTSAIREVGTRLRDYRLSIQNQGLTPYRTLLKEYRSSVSELGQEIQASLQDQQRLAVEGYSLAGGPDQPVGATGQLLFSETIYPCADYKMNSGLPDAGGAIALKLTEEQRAQFYAGISNRFKVAHHLKLGRLDVCLASAQWEEPTITELNRKEHRNSGNPERGSTGEAFTEVYQTLTGRASITIREAFRLNDGGLYPIEKTRIAVGSPKPWGVRRVDRRGSAETLRWQREDVSLFETISRAESLAVVVAKREGAALLGPPQKQRTMEVVGTQLKNLFSKTADAVRPLVASKGVLREQLDRITGSRALILAAVSLALPTSMKTNDSLRSSFFGAHELLDGDAIGSLTLGGKLGTDAIWAKLAVSRADHLEGVLGEVLKDSEPRLESELELDTLNADLIALEKDRHRALEDITSVYEQLSADVDAAISAHQ